MKQHKAPRKTGTRKHAPRAGAKRKVAGRKAATPKVTPRKRAPGPLMLPADCVIGSVPELRTALVSRVSSETAVTLDAAKVERIDTASLQLLAAFVRERRAAGLAFEWAGVPDAVTEAAALLNLTTHLGLAAPANSTVPA
jgi:ABC-type transporter Mla MlaB component